ncbi:protein Z-dependent protease inhibitor-like [Pristis pectinata]|uniref:protein Z-dependent protease inhibitor-like n=1 Tax=Pristis pectinata TaxID=685728 RepID=UPI00223CE8ED|nr:protein Z-dependent protease inhibitor-like [Pristis pectinata]XP_051873014.1 protein Z-dependent protease inhibitor-like [Pristis pectinata]XP_051873025.1 protein Z-dependent protease inhibitor-like [Pristis pectinata]
MEMKFFIFLLFGGFMVTTLTQRQQTQFNSEYRKDLPQNFSLGSHSAEVTPVQLEEAESIPDLQTTYMLTEKNSEFGFNLYRKIANLHEDNVFFSPNSISTTFAMLSLGAKGETRNNILQGLNIVNFANSSNKYQLHRLFQWLHSNITSNKDLLISQGNSLFIQNDLELKQTFINDLSHFYNADITPVNFQDTVNTKDIINQYIRNRTSGKINELLDSVDAGARLMFINYNLFKGKWKSPFDPNLTVDGIFYVNAYTRVKVPMMYKEGSFLLTYDNNHSCTVLKLPYKGSASMLVVMPTDAGYQLLEDELSAELIGQWIEALRVKRIDLYFPRFKLDKSYKMEKKLRQLGMTRPFTNSADLSGISSSYLLKISEVIHKAVINVDEKGTEAAAVTGTFALPYSLPPVIKIDHPFLFMIHEDITKTLLFIGRVKDPTKL